MKHMKSFKKALLYGFLTWLIVFIIGHVVYIVNDNDIKSLLPKSIMALAIITISMIFALIYFKNVERNFVKEGFYLGLIFFLINIAIDLPLFLLGGPMKTSFGNYMLDIGFTYILYFLVTIGIGYVLEKKR